MSGSTANKAPAINSPIPFSKNNVLAALAILNFSWSQSVLNFLNKIVWPGRISHTIYICEFSIQCLCVNLRLAVLVQQLPCVLQTAHQCWRSRTVEQVSQNEGVVVYMCDII